MHLIDLPFEVLTQNDGFKGIEILNCVKDRVAVYDYNTKYLTYQPVQGIIICPTYFEKSIYSNPDSYYSAITTTRSPHNTILTSSNGILDTVDRANSRAFVRNLKPESNNYYDNEIINEFEIELNNLHEACEMQKIALHAGLIAEIFENHMEQKYKVKFFDEHSSPNAIEVQRIAGIGNFAAYILVEDMERKKIVVRVKNNSCYKIYFA